MRLNLVPIFQISLLLFSPALWGGEKRNCFGREEVVSIMKRKCSALSPWSRALSNVVMWLYDKFGRFGSASVWLLV